MATRRTARKTPLKGRAQVALGLVLFVIVTAAVVWRRSEGVATARAMQVLRQEQRTLRAEQQDLENDLRRASSRRSIVAEAERRLGMRIPSESQTRFLPPSAFAESADSVVIADSAAIDIGGQS
ncbi:MAG: cell division protein FtsL [Gemmatimonadaceae bacterium]|nr:cell division protein FtsL [Gemmatimonadaceae bacterium]